MGISLESQLAPSVETELSLLKDMRDILRIANPRAGGRKRDFSGAGGLQPRLYRLDLDDQTHHVPIPNAYQINFLRLPETLTSFLVRVNDPSAEAFNILFHGRTIKWEVPITDLYIDSTPSLTGGGDFGTNVFYTLGDSVIEDWRPSLYDPLVVSNGNRNHRIRTQTALPIAYSTPVDPTSDSGDVLIADALGDTGLITGIPVSTEFKVRWRISAELPSTAALTGVWRLKIETGGGAIIAVLDAARVPESAVIDAGKRDWTGESAWINSPATGIDITFQILGTIAGNFYHVSLELLSNDNTTAAAQV